MALQYKPTKHAFKTEGVPVTEQEHKASCDINKMIKDIHRGRPVRGSNYKGTYGYDDTTMDAVQHRIMKQELEEQLAENAAHHELEEEHFKQLDPQIAQKFGFKTKKAKTTAKNDDQTTTKANVEKPNVQETNPKTNPV